MRPQTPMILASGSAIRADLLRREGLTFDIIPGRIDEEAVRRTHEAEGGSARDLADLLAELKARKISDKHPGTLVIGADQVLECGGRIFTKAGAAAEATDHLAALSGRTHHLLSACVVCRDGAPLWRHVGHVRLTMHPLSPSFIADYLDRNWHSVGDAVGCYKIEEEGPRLFSRIEGDFFHILGLPLIELLTWLHIRGDIAT